MFVKKLHEILWWEYRTSSDIQELGSICKERVKACTISIDCKTILNRVKLRLIPINCIRSRQFSKNRMLFH